MWSFEFAEDGGGELFAGARSFDSAFGLAQDDPAPIRREFALNSCGAGGECGGSLVSRMFLIAAAFITIFKGIIAAQSYLAWLIHRAQGLTQQKALHWPVEPLAPGPALPPV